jgi:hypothetical protein
MYGAIAIVLSSSASVNISTKRYIGLSWMIVSDRCEGTQKVLTYFSSRHCDNNEISSSQNSTGRSVVGFFSPSTGIFPRIIDSKESLGFDGKACFPRASIVRRCFSLGR